MPAYATWLQRELAQWWRNRQVARNKPHRCDLSQTVFFSDFEPDGDLIVETLGGLPAMIVLPDEPAARLGHCVYGRFEPGTNPLNLSEEVEAEIRTRLHTAAFFIPRERVYGKTLLALRELGVKRCIFCAGKRPGTARPLIEAAKRRIARLVTEITPGKQNESISIQQAHEILKRYPGSPSRASSHSALSSPSTLSPQRSGLFSIGHYIGTLNAGGAERQLCYTAAAQKRDGHEVRTLLTYPPVGGDGHYLPLLRENNIPTRQAGDLFHDDFLARFNDAEIDFEALAALPDGLRNGVADLAGELLVNPVDILHCWLDEPNIVGFLAGRLAGVPGIILSVRNVSPMHCPRLMQPWMRAWYHVAAGCEGVQIVSNSQAGGEDYQRWIGRGPGTIEVLRNAFVPPRQPSHEQIASLRSELGIEQKTPLIAGVFRLDPEKRPLVFLEVIDRIRQQNPAVHVVHIGRGTLNEQVEREIEKRNLATHLTMLGRREDVPAVLAAADVMVLTSDIEGTPNVSLEAQYLGCVPVVTNAGGSAEAIEPGKTGLLFERDDLTGLVDGVLELLEDPARREEMAAAGKSFVASRFNPEQIHHQTMSLYRKLTGNDRD